MQYVLTAAEMKQYDSNTIQKIGIPQAVLMERAALAAYEVIKQHREETTPELLFPDVLIAAGCGNNGGDGLALARLLVEAGYHVSVWIVGNMDKASEGFAGQYRILKNYSVSFVTQPLVSSYTYVVDALFGTGLSRNVEGIYASAVEYINSIHGTKVALDIPSGICSDSGMVLGCAVKADITVAFAYAKRGHYFYPGCLYAGKLYVKDIGISEIAFIELRPQMFLYNEDYRELLPRRKPDGNKGTFGKVLILSGSLNMAGAAVLCSKACARLGAGMVKVITPEENRVILQTAVPEVMLGSYDDVTASLQWADIILAGPGLGKSDKAKQALKMIIAESGLPLVLDADALNLLAEDDDLRRMLSAEGESGRTVVITPHMGEFSRLTGKTIAELKADPVGHGLAAASVFHSVVVVKDARTVVCSPDGRCCLNITGNSGMAAAGSGDVLAGMIASLLAQGLDGFTAASSGVYIHGSIGDAVAKEIGEHALMAGDLINERLLYFEEQRIMPCIY